MIHSCSLSVCQWETCQSNNPKYFVNSVFRRMTSLYLMSVLSYFMTDKDLCSQILVPYYILHVLCVQEPCFLLLWVISRVHSSLILLHCFIYWNHFILLWKYTKTLWNGIFRHILVDTKIILRFVIWPYLWLRTGAFYSAYRTLFYCMRLNGCMSNSPVDEWWISDGAELHHNMNEL